MSAPATLRGVLALWLGLWASGCAFIRSTEDEPLPERAEVVFVKTDDGAVISLIHYKPEATPAVPNRPPVLLLHGYGCNSGYWTHLTPLLDAARIGVLVGSGLAAVLGLAMGRAWLPLAAPQAATATADEAEIDG